MNGVILGKIQAEICQSAYQTLIREYKAEYHQHIVDEEYHD
jgi:hypothetical protein